MSESVEFDRLHGIGTGEEHSIFTDRDPATSVKGCGFRNLSVALQTLLLIEQPGSRYKQYWTIRAMLERAKRHPVLAHNAEALAGSGIHERKSIGSAASMLDAIRVFEDWLRERETSTTAQRKGVTNTPAVEYVDERAPSAHPSPCKFDSTEMAQRARFASSRILNRHGCSAEQERLNGLDIQRRLRQDQADAKKSLRQAIAQAKFPEPSNWFPLVGPSFSSLFGGPGVHGYGTLRDISETTMEATDASSTVVRKLIVSVRATETIETFSDPKSNVDKEGPTWIKSLQERVGVKRHLQIEREIALRKDFLPDPGGISALELGKAFHDFESFDLEYDVFAEEARLSSWRLKMNVARPLEQHCRLTTRQPSVIDFFNMKRPREEHSNTNGYPSNAGGDVVKHSYGARDERRLDAGDQEGSTKRMRQNTNVIVLSDSED